ncbi:hypothetical protein N182_34180 [Sinorhizobium sp. GL2]|nr:hypothetical protein N182_34180 [Sinorhizobium sp. GL2]
MLVELDPHQKRQYDKFRISCMDIAHALQYARLLCQIDMRCRTPDCAR